LADWESADDAAAPVVAANKMTAKGAATPFDIDQPITTPSETEIGWLLLRLLDDDADDADENADF